MSSEVKGNNAWNRWAVWLVVVAFALLTGYYFWQSRGGSELSTPRIALVTSDKDPYWEAVIAGARDAAEKFNVELSVHQPENSDEQSLILMELSNNGMDGIAVSPATQFRQGVALARVASRSNLVTVDSDMPVSRRLCYVGTDNYAAGRVCGRLIKEALPDGGIVAICMADADRYNGDRRRQGIIDELFDHSDYAARESDPHDVALTEGKYTIAPTLFDKSDWDKAEALAKAALEDDTPPDCLVGIYASNTPAIVRGAKASGRLGEVKIVGFDHLEETLKAVEEGYVFGTVVQDAYLAGYYAVRILQGVARGHGDYELPLFQNMYLPVTAVRQNDVADIRLRLKGKAPTTIVAASSVTNSDDVTEN